MEDRTGALSAHPTSPQAFSSPDLSARQRVLTWAMMKLSRDLDNRFAMLLKTGRVAKWYSQIGTEATSTAAGMELDDGDVLCSLHRDLGAILSVYLDPARAFPDAGFAAKANRPEPVDLLYRLCCQLLGRRDGFSEGIERSFHYAHLAPETGVRHVGMISHLGSMIPVAAGCAFALKQGGSDRVALNFIGDGGTSTGDFHEGLNMAAVWKLPLILVVENNRYAFSTPTSAQFACAQLSDRGPGYGIAAETVDGNNPDAVAHAVATAVARARRGDGPTLIEAMLGRMRGHSEGDDSLKVVPEDELNVYLAADPVPAHTERMRRDGTLSESEHDRLGAQISDLIETAVERALASPEPEVETAHRSVFAPLASTWSEPIETVDREISYVEAVHLGLLAEMERDDSVVLMGQDIGVFEGAFRITKGMWQRWPDRVLDTPIAESGTMGIAAGAAMLGYRPVVEMQFADFISCGFNQLVNVSAKMYYRWGIPCPIVVRLPAGGGVGAGPFHSQNPEGWFAHTGGIKVVCPSTVDDARLLLQAAIRDPNPVVFCEHKYLYRRIKAVPTPGAVVEPLGNAAVRREGSDLTLVAYGASVWQCLAAADTLAADGIEAEVIDLRTLVPFDADTVLTSVEKTGRCVIVHEDQLTAGFGAEVAAQIADKAFAWLDAPVKRVAYPDRPSPFSKLLENALMPDAEKVVAAARETVAY
ncbi:MAG: dehydrogenase E1 component subunit alpha/beta [Acidobacteriota bacterium]